MKSFSALSLQLCVYAVLFGFSQASLPISTSGDNILGGESLGGDGYYHYRICEGKTATFSCSGKIHVGGCWYGAPANEIDGLSNLCSHAQNRVCNPDSSGCVGYSVGQCEGQSVCSVTVSNSAWGNGFDPCPNTYKYGAFAIRCDASSAHSEPAALIPDADSPGTFDFSQLSSTYKNGAAVLVFLLLINLVCMAHYHCCSGQKGRSRVRYEKVAVVASDDDLQQLKA
eukprot:CAMPEP_0202688646 /NCGR_PEP_ID=MMETSP1385-20130828/4125_1 /ASSEMBLY_ACC=CAM_ASM_000861 /TAXON_ID=933848 /ORGANISM="Elphidium margaritaceum" /LENGTH=226 /DNA_ID=CAMNT_0049343665 /DNA_START=87 /DNA_END=767 /DNA_ORIENTATION=-